MPRADFEGISIEYDTAGPADGLAVLLVMGLGSQMIAWPPQLIEPLADAGLRVVWFDNRDVGRSTWLDQHPPRGLAELLADARSGTLPAPPYTLTDMAGDAAALLDHLDVDGAHVVGVSMGGMIAQRLAWAFPQHVRSLTSVMSSTGAPGLPGPSPQAAQALFAPAPTDREGYVAASLGKREVLGSPGFDQDHRWLRTTSAASYDRGLNPAGFLRQYHAILADGDRTPLLGQISVPTLVVHGTADPLVPLAAGRATAEAVPGAVLEVIDGMGHDLPPGVCEILVAQLLAHVRG